MNHAPQSRRFPALKPLLVFAAVAIFTLIAGFYLLSAELREGRRIAQQQLLAIGRLKTRELINWRKERLGDANFLQRTPAVVADATAVLSQPTDRGAQQRLRGWLDTIKGGRRYESILVINPRGEIVSSLSDSAAADVTLTPDILAATLASPKIIFGDLTRSGTEQKLHLDLLIPIRPVGSPPKSLAQGVIVLRLDPDRFLFPFIKSWPLQSSSAEAILIRREGSEVRYLNGLRHRLDPALSLKRSVNEPELIAARAARGALGVFEGVSYRGVGVLSSIHQIKDSSWILIAEIDLEEIYAPIRADAWKTGGLFALLLATVALLIFTQWRRQQSHHLQNLLEVELQRNVIAERLALITQHVNDAITLFSEDGQILEANDYALRLYGRTLAEMRTLRAADLRAPEMAAQTAADFAQALTSEGVRFETIHQRSDGTRFPVEANAKLVLIDGRRHVLSIVRDVSQRRAQEDEIHRLNRIYQVLCYVNQAIVHTKNPHELLGRVCKVLVELGGFKIAWAGWLDPITQRIDLIASAGDAHGYFTNLRISADPALAEGRGPAGIAFREDRIYVCNDFLAAEVTLPWHDAAARSGIRSSISLPVRFEGKPVGLVTAYTDTKDYFGAHEIPLMEEIASDISFALDVFSRESRRRADAESLQKLSRIVEQAPLSILITDLTGAITYVNPTFCEISGYTEAEVLGQNPRILKSGETSPEVHANMWSALTRGQVWRGEMSNRRKNGEIYIEQEVIAPVIDETGNTTYYVALKEDITATKRTSEALREAQERYRLIADHTADVIWLFDFKLDRFIYCSPSVQKLLDFTEEEMRGKTLFDVLAPASADEISEVLPRRLAAYAAGDPAAITRTEQLQQIRRDGSYVWTETVSTLLPDAHGTVPQFIGVSRDITERVLAREALEKFNAELEDKVAARTAELAARNREVQGLLSSIPDTVMRLRIDGTVLYKQPARTSPALAALTHPSDQTGVDPALIAPCLELGRRALLAASTVTTETTVQLPETVIAIELRAAPSGADEFVVFAQDITARRRLAAETEAMLEKERQVSELKTRFISVTSHEFRTPMAAVMGSAELLRNHLDKLTPAKRDELFDRITTALQRMTAMLDDILTLNRMDANRVEVRLVPTDLRLFLQDVIEEIRLADHGTHLVVTCFLPDGPTPLLTDVNLLRHIVSNLLSNAVRYSPAGRTITVEMNAASDRVLISVEDQGIGIPAGDLGRIFQPFERGSNVGNIKGTGLGLSIVKRMTELLGGSIALSPTPHGGCRFTLDLPRNPKPSPTP
jgi:PAS domain S-box-containing protein